MINLSCRNVWRLKKKKFKKKRKPNPINSRESGPRLDKTLNRLAKAVFIFHSTATPSTGQNKYATRAYVYEECVPGEGRGVRIYYFFTRISVNLIRSLLDFFPITIAASVSSPFTIYGVTDHDFFNLVSSISSWKKSRPLHTVVKLPPPPLPRLNYAKQIVSWRP